MVSLSFLLRPASIRILGLHAYWSPNDLYFINNALSSSLYSYIVVVSKMDYQGSALVGDQQSHSEVLANESALTRPANAVTTV